MEKSIWGIGILEWFLNSRPRTPKNVLVVEDDEVMKPIFARALYQLNDRLNLSWAPSVREAQRFLEAGPFDLVITDVCLEGDGTGMDLQRYLSEKFPDVPVVVTSGLSREAILSREGVDVDERDFIPKPVNLQLCLDKIHGVIERRWFSKAGTSIF